MAEQQTQERVDPYTGETQVFEPDTHEIERGKQPEPVQADEGILDDIEMFGDPNTGELLFRRKDQPEAEEEEKEEAGADETEPSQPDRVDWDRIESKSDEELTTWERALLTERKRRKDAQGWGTKQSQELARLRRELEDLKAAKDQEPEQVLEEPEDIDLFELSQEDPKKAQQALDERMKYNAQKAVQEERKKWAKVMEPIIKQQRAFQQFAEARRNLPHFKEMQSDVLELIRNGEADNYEDAYYEAIRRNPERFEKAQSGDAAVTSSGGSDTRTSEERRVSETPGQKDGLVRKDEVDRSATRLKSAETGVGEGETERRRPKSALEAAEMALRSVPYATSGP